MTPSCVVLMFSLIQFNSPTFCCKTNKFLSVIEKIRIKLPFEASVFTEYKCHPLTYTAVPLSYYSFGIRYSGMQPTSLGNRAPLTGPRVRWTETERTLLQKPKNSHILTIVFSFHCSHNSSISTCEKRHLVFQILFQIYLLYQRRCSTAICTTNLNLT
jgi:hypothetical protein